MMGPLIPAILSLGVVGLLYLSTKKKEGPNGIKPPPVTTMPLPNGDTGPGGLPGGSWTTTPTPAGYLPTGPFAPGARVSRFPGAGVFVPATQTTREPQRSIPFSMSTTLADLVAKLSVLWAGSDVVSITASYTPPAIVVRVPGSPSSVTPGKFPTSVGGFPVVIIGA